MADGLREALEGLELENVDEVLEKLEKGGVTLGRLRRGVMTVGDLRELGFNVGVSRELLSLVVSEQRVVCFLFFFLFLSFCFLFFVFFFFFFYCACLQMLIPLFLVPSFSLFFWNRLFEFTKIYGTSTLIYKRSMMIC